MGVCGVGGGVGWEEEDRLWEEGTQRQSLPHHL